MTLGKGKAAAITAADIARLADSLQVHPADLEAIALVESGGFGWFPDGRIKILFEKHCFHKLLSPSERALATADKLARPKWISPAAGGYKDQATAGARYALLERAIKLNRDAAFQSISIGTYQIMGFNHAICGHQTAEGMFNAFCESELYQLSALAGFLTNKGLLPAIRARDFAKVETIYNGGGLKGAYAKHMRQESDKLRAGKWAGYKPGAFPAASADPKPTKDAGSVIAQGPVPSGGGWLAGFLLSLLNLLKGRRA